MIDCAQIDEWCVKNEKKAPADLVEAIIRLGFSDGIVEHNAVSLKTFNGSLMGKSLKKSKSTPESDTPSPIQVCMGSPVISAAVKCEVEPYCSAGDILDSSREKESILETRGPLSLTREETKTFCEKLRKMVMSAGCPLKVYAHIVKKRVPLTEAVLRGCPNNPELNVKLADEFVELLGISAKGLIDGDNNLVEEGAEVIRGWKDIAQNYFDAQAKVLKEARRGKEMTLDELVSLTGISLHRFEAFEAAKYVPNAAQFVTIANALTVQVSELVLMPPEYLAFDLKLKGCKTRESTDTIDDTFKEQDVALLTQHDTSQVKDEAASKNWQVSLSEQNTGAIKPVAKGNPPGAERIKLSHDQCSLFSERVLALCELEDFSVRGVIEVMTENPDENFIVPKDVDVDWGMGVLLWNVSAVADFFGVNVGDLINHDNNTIFDKCQALEKKRKSEADKCKHQARLIVSFMDMLHVGAEELASHIGVSVEEVRSFIDGNEPPTENNLIAMANYFEVPVDEFIV